MSAPAAPPPPDYSQIANASQASAQLNAEIAAQQLDWAKEQFNRQFPYTQKVQEGLLSALNENQANARTDRARYQDIYQPLEDIQAKEAVDYTSPEHSQFLRARAIAGVSQAYDAEDKNATRMLEGYGVKPSDTRATALNASIGTSKAAAEAAAANNSDLTTEATGRQLVANAVNVGRGYPGQVAQSYGTATNAGTSGVGVGNQTTATYMPALGNPLGFTQASNQSLGTWSDALSRGYQGALAQYGANQNSSSGVGAGLGLIGSLGSAAILAARKGGVVPSYAGGGVTMDNPPNMNGVVIPRGASPSGGSIRDDVTLKAEPGEFIVPKRAVMWHGEKHFQKLIQKADEERAAATAKPEFKPAMPTPPTFHSPGAVHRRTGGALRGQSSIPARPPLAPRRAVPMRF